MESVLVLNVDYSPLEVISWRSAIEKLVMGKVHVVEAYADRFVRSTSVVFALPAVVRLTGAFVRRRVRLSRANILARDAYTCQYCGSKPRRRSGHPDLEALTIDHVVPRADAVDGWVTLPWTGRRVRTTCWENVLVACKPCNRDKAAKSLKQAGLRPRKLPAAPTAREIAWMSIFRHKIPEEWAFYLPENSPWRDYWTGELEP